MFSTAEYKLFQADTWPLQKIQQQANNSPIAHFLSAKSLKEIFLLEQYVKSCIG